MIASETPGMVAMAALCDGERCLEVAHKTKYLLAVTSGVRDGELHGLQIADTHLKDEPSISVTRSMALVSKTKLPGLQPPKTEHGERDVPLHPLAACALDWWLTTGWELHVGRKPKPTDPVFPNHAGDHHRPRSSDQLRADLLLAGQEPEFKGHPITFHALRRSFSTYISRHPSAPMVKADLMGHASETVAGQHYDGELDDLKRAVICSIDLPVTVGDILRETPEEMPGAAPE